MRISARRGFIIAFRGISSTMRTTTGTLYDVDGFTINRSYNVRWGGGSYMYVGPNVYTRIHDYNKATCNQNSSGAVYCTIS